MFPPYPVIETETSITMKSDYDGLEQVNKSVAASAALDFISQVWYLSTMNISYEYDKGGLDDGNWYLRFLGENLTITIGVNAISGKVDYFSPIWPIGRSPFIPNVNEDRYASTTEIEKSAFDFLYQFNYSLSPFARYVGPVTAYDYIHHHNVSRISLYNFVDGALIENNGVHLLIDLEASAILSFSYRWVFIDSIPTEKIISPERAEQFAIDYLVSTMNLSEYEIDATSLVFEMMWTPTGHEYRLGWIVVLHTDSIAAIHVDAKSGSFYNMGFSSTLDYDSPSGAFGPTISAVSASQIMCLFIGSTFVALMASVIVRRRAMLSLSR
jgi:hypothetical protein